MMSAEPPTASSAVPATALYVNYFEVGHSPFEFLLDLGQYRSDAGGIAIHTRIATGPSYAKLLALLLDRAVREHEAVHGRIPDLDGDEHPFDTVYRSLPEFAQRAERKRADSRPQPR